MPVVALPLFWGAVAAGTSAAAGIYGAHQSSSAGKYAADLQAQAAQRTADLEAKATADKLAFDKQQAAQTQANAAATQKLNYGQWAAHQSNLAALGSLIGAPPRNIPAYEDPITVPDTPPPASAPPTTDPRNPDGSTTFYRDALGGPSTLAPSPTAPATPPPGNYGDLSDPKVWLSLVGDDAKLGAWVQQGLGPKGSSDLVNYYVGKIKGQPGANETEQRGSANYWLQKLQNDPNITGKALPPEGVAKVKPPIGSLASATPNYLPFAPQPTPFLSSSY